MYIKKSIAMVASLAVLAGGYVAGAFIGIPNVDKTLLGGDIGKVKAYNEAGSPEVQAAMEQLANDTTLQKETAVSAVLLGCKVKEMNELLADDKTRKHDIEIQLPPVIIEIIKILQASASNTQQAYDKYTEALAAVMKGEKVENFEQIANNAYLAYTMMDRNMRAASPQIVDGLMEVAEKKESKEVAEYAAKWIEFNAEDAFLDNSMERVTYWNDKMEALANTPKIGFVTKPIEAFRAEKFLGKTSAMINNSKALQSLCVVSNLSAIFKGVDVKNEFAENSNNVSRINVRNNVKELAERNVQELAKVKRMLEDWQSGGSYEALGKNILPGKMETYISLRDNSLGRAFGMLGSTVDIHHLEEKAATASPQTLGIHWW